MAYCSHPPFFLSYVYFSVSLLGIQQDGECWKHAFRTHRPGREAKLRGENSLPGCCPSKCESAEDFFKLHLGYSVPGLFPIIRMGRGFA